MQDFEALKTATESLLGLVTQLIGLAEQHPDYAALKAEVDQKIADVNAVLNPPAP